MPAHTAKLVTIVCEAPAREAVTSLVQGAGADGYTIFPVEGMGAHLGRTAEATAFANLQLQVIVSSDECDRLMARLEQELFAKYAMVAYESDVRVRRRSTFF